DPDSGASGVVRYSLVNHPANDFDIDEKTGQIFTVSVAGKSGTFDLEVQAADQGTRQLTARTTVKVTVDASSRNNIVTVVLNQKVNMVERNIAEVKRVLAANLAWNIYVIAVHADGLQGKARSSTDATYVEILAFDEANEVPAEAVKSKLWERKSTIETQLEKVFSAPVTAAVEEPPEDSATPELTATIVLGVLLACTLAALLVHVVLTVKRRRYRDRAEVMTGVDNPCVTGSNGSLKN
ncbi:FAT4 protein, partial [Upupa epops]|nr:FAT4 protein [Upupa epops]